MIKYLKILIFSIFLIGCSPKNNNSTEETKINILTPITSLGSINIETVASNNIQTITIGQIKDDDGKLVNGENFSIFSLTSGLSFKDSQGLFKESLTKIIENGMISFEFKTPTIKGLYRFGVKALQRDSNTSINYIQVKNSSVNSLGGITTNYFVDEAPYDGIKNQTEYYAIDFNLTTIYLGPIKDQFNNLIDGEIVDVTLDGALFSDDTTSKTLQVNNGFVYSEIKYNNALNLIKVTTSKGLINSDSFLKVISSSLGSDSSLMDFGNIFNGSSDERTITLTNQGNVKINSLDFLNLNSFFIKNTTCSQLNPNSSCSITFGFNAQSKGFFEDNIEIYSSDLNKNLASIQLRASVVNPAQVDIVNNFLIFDDTEVGETSYKNITFINRGDVPVQLTATNPPPYIGLAESYYQIEFLDATHNFGNITYCGDTLYPMVKCSVRVKFSPLTVTSQDVLGGTINPIGLAPISFFVKGKSFENNYKSPFAIFSDKNSIIKDNTDTMEITVGPILNKVNSPVSGVVVEVDLYQLDSNNVRKKMGQITSNQELIGTNPNLRYFTTDSDGMIYFSLKTKNTDLVENIYLEAKIKDNKQRVLAESNVQFSVSGFKLKFLENINYLSSYVNNQYNKIITLKNEGDLNAEQIIFNKYGTDLNNIFINDEGTCLGLTNGGLHLSPDEACQFELAFNPTQKKNYIFEIEASSPLYGISYRTNVFGEVFSPINLVVTNSNLNANYITGSQSLQGTFSLYNFGDENAVNLSFDSSPFFTFDDDCNGEIVKQSICQITWTYTPTVINQPVTAFPIDINAEGSISQQSKITSINLTIQHGNTKFNILGDNFIEGSCIPMNIEIVDQNNANVSFNLFEESIKGKFYQDVDCLSQINSIEVDNVQISEVFYYKGDVLGQHNLKAESSQVSSTSKNIPVVGLPYQILIGQGNNKSAIFNQPSKVLLSFQLTDSVGNGVPLKNITLKTLKDIDNLFQLIPNYNFHQSNNGWNASFATIENKKAILSGNGASAGFIETSNLTQLDINKEYLLSVDVGFTVGANNSGLPKISILRGNSSIISQFVGRSGVNTYKIKTDDPNVKIRVENNLPTAGAYTYVNSIRLTEYPPYESSINLGSLDNPNLTTNEYGIIATNYTAGKTFGTIFVEAFSPDIQDELRQVSILNIKLNPYEIKSCYDVFKLKEDMVSDYLYSIKLDNGVLENAYCNLDRFRDAKANNITSKVVLSGDTFTMNAGQTYRYMDFIVEEGAVIEITDNNIGSTYDQSLINPVKIIVEGNFDMRGEFVARNGKHNGGTSVISGVFDSLNFEIVQNAGGRGGRSCYGCNIISGYSGQNCGNGGGGAGADFAYASGASCEKASNGASNDFGGGNGYGEYVWSKSGSAGSCGSLRGAGGGGGSKGAHGNNVYIYANIIEGVGSFDLSGSNAGNGGNGNPCSLAWGGGGGGGSGGSGGNLIIDYVNYNDDKMRFLSTFGNKGFGGSSKYAFESATYDRYAEFAKGEAGQDGNYGNFGNIKIRQLNKDGVVFNEQNYLGGNAPETVFYLYKLIAETSDLGKFFVDKMIDNPIDNINSLKAEMDYTKQFFYTGGYYGHEEWFYAYSSDRRISNSFRSYVDGSLPTNFGDTNGFSATVWCCGITVNYDQVPTSATTFKTNGSYLIYAMKKLKDYSRMRRGIWNIDGSYSDTHKYSYDQRMSNWWYSQLANLKYVNEFYEMLQTYRPNRFQIDNFILTGQIPPEALITYGGDLIVPSGKTISLNAGVVRKYDSIFIESGGTLRIVGNSLKLTEILVEGNLVLNGKIEGNGFFVGNSLSTNSVLTQQNVNFSVQQKNGGVGGYAWTGYYGGAQYAGNGSGGGKGDLAGIAGSGAQGLSASESSPGPSQGGDRAGGAGGLRGNHGHSLILVVQGNISGNGEIDLSGKMVQMEKEDTMVRMLEVEAVGALVEVLVI